MVIPGSATSYWVGQGVDSCAFNGGTDVVAVRMCLSGRDGSVGEIGLRC